MMCKNSLRKFLVFLILFVVVFYSQAELIPFEDEHIKLVPIMNIPRLPYPPVIKDIAFDRKVKGDQKVTCKVLPGSSSVSGIVILSYSTDYIGKSVNYPPTWNSIPMRKTTTTNEYEAIIPAQPTDTKVHFYIEAYDCFSDPPRGVYTNMSTFSRTPTSFPTWGWWKDYYNWTGATANLIGEYENFGFPKLYKKEPVTPSELDIKSIWVARGNPGMGNTLYIKMELQGNITKGVEGLHGSYAYIVFIQNLQRPDDPLTEKPEGLFAVLYFPNYAQTSGILHHYCDLINLEKNYERIKIPLVDLVPLSYHIQYRHIFIGVPMNALQVEATPLHSNYEPYSFLIAGATGVVEYVGYVYIPGFIPLPVIPMMEVKDLTNTVRYYYRPIYFYRQE